MEQMRTEVAFLASAATARKCSNIPCSRHEPNLELSLPCRSTSAQSDTLTRAVCSHICLWVNLTLVVFKGCDRRSRRLPARLSKPVLGHCCRQTIHNELRKKVKQGRGVCRASYSLLSTQAWPDESRAGNSFQFHVPRQILVFVALGSAVIHPLEHRDAETETFTCFASKHWAHLNIRKAAPGCRLSAERRFIVPNWFR